MNLLLLINHHISHCQQMSTMQQKPAQQATQPPVGQQVVYRHTPHHAAQLLRDAPNAPRKPRHNMPLDLAPLVCSAATFAAEIEDAQDPVTPLYVPRMEPPKLNKRR
jgi:hypothetical protein